MAAGQQSFVNNDKYDQLKQSINFDQLVTALPDDRLVMVDWLNLLTSFNDDEGKQWKISYPSIAMGQYDGRLGANLVGGDEEMRVEILSFSQGQKVAIDAALRKVTNTSAPFVIYQLGNNGIGDFCLIPTTRDYEKFMIFVYGNILVELEHFGEDKDVLSVARYMQAAMEKAVAANPEQKLPARPTFNYKVNPPQPRIDEPFLVQVSPSQVPDGWEFDVAEKRLTDNVEYEEDMGGGSYKFTVDTVGSENVIFNLMDKRTLWIYTDTVPVNIE